MRSNLVTSGNKGESDIPTMSRDTTAGPAFGQVSKSIERSGTPSPPPGPAAPSTSHLMLPSLSFTAPTPDASPVTPIKRTGHQEAATETPQSVLKPNIAPIGRSANTGHKGKRKADEADAEGGNTPKDQPRATFAEPRPHRASGNSGSSRATNSGSSRAPSSYHRKRARLSTTPESRPGSRASVDVQNATNTGSWSSKASSRHPPQSPRPSPGQQSHREPSRRSISSVSIHGSIPISALISPHAPSIQGSSVFHMRDPRKPRPIQPTPWSLSMPLSGDGSWLERGGSPLHAWLFFVGFLIFPIWWVAVFVGIPRTRRLGGNEVEKGVVLDDPQLEFDANSWRKRCRIMAVVSFFTYIPFVILVAIFVR